MNLVQVGDVIKADDKWLYGHGDSDPRGRVFVGFSSPHIVQDGKGNILSSYDRTDKTRPGSLFVVEQAMSGGGGTGHGPNDVYPDGWQITARRLLPDGSYDSEGEVVQFYQTGCFSCMVEQPEVVGHMVKQFVWQK